MTDPIIETREVVFCYGKGARPSLDRVSIKIGKGVKTAILGANGAGKSTLFYHLNGVFEPTEGEVLFRGNRMSYRKKALKELRSHVAVVLQNPDDQVFGQTVEADVAYGPTNMGLSKEEIAERTESALQQVGLWEFREKNSLQLSYGQRKRLSLAGALAMKPDVLIMDEPTAGLDPQMALEIMELAEQLHHSGTDIVISTHDVDLAYMWADEIHVLRGGEKLYSGQQEGFYSDPSLTYSAGLLQPSMFQINQTVSEMRGVDPRPYPQTEPQLIAKAVKGPRGRLIVVPLTSEVTRDRVEEISKEVASVGIYGARARRATFEDGFPVDFIFGGFESCMSQILVGEDSALICDSECLDLIEAKIAKMSDFGDPIDFTILSS